MGSGVGVGGVGVRGVGVGGVGVGGLGSEGLGSRELGSGGLGSGGVGVGKVVVLASNSPRIKSSSRQIVMHPWANGTCLGLMGMWGLGQMSIWENGLFGTDEHWDKWALGEIWALGENKHQEKLVPGQTSGLFAANEHFGPNGHFGNDEHWGRWALGVNRQLGLMGTRKNEHQGKSAFEANGHLGSMDIGANGHWGEMGTRKNEHQSKWALGSWGK